MPRTVASSQPPTSLPRHGLQLAPAAACAAPAFVLAAPSGRAAVLVLYFYFCLYKVFGRLVCCGAALATIVRPHSLAGLLVVRAVPGLPLFE
eukprot:13326279-Alexandrium_andersonii.AAC.1